MEKTITKTEYNIKPITNVCALAQFSKITNEAIQKAVYDGL